MSVMRRGGADGEPSLQVQSKVYEWRFPVDPLNVMLTRLVGIPGNGGFSGLVKSSVPQQTNFRPTVPIPTLKDSGFTRRDLKFNEDDDFLGKIQHSWEFGVSLAPYTASSPPCMFATILLWIVDPRETISVPEVKIQMCHGLQQLHSGIVNLKSEERSGRQGYRGWLFTNEIPSSAWNQVTDSVKVIFKFRSSESSSLGVPNPLEVNMKQHFLSEFLSDVKLVSGGQEFPAHRFVLACKSPIFERMFKSPMKETLEGRVDIGDIEPNILKEMLSYIYTGEFTAKNLLQDVYVCMELYKSADKYGFQDLKIQCANEIVKKVMFENALDVYVLGRTTVETTLIKKALEVMKRDKAKFLRDPNTLLELAKRYPELAYELATM